MNILAHDSKLDKFEPMSKLSLTPTATPGISLVMYHSPTAERSLVLDRCLPALVCPLYCSTT